MRRQDLKNRMQGPGFSNPRAVECWTLCLDRDAEGRVIALSQGFVDQPVGSMSSLQALLKTTLDEILSFSEGEALVFQALSQNVSIALVEEEGNGVRLDTDQRAILVPTQALEPEAIARSPYFRNQFLAHVIEGLRAWDQTRRLGEGTKTLRPDQAILWARAAAADRQAMVVLCAFKLKQQGKPGLWRHLLGSPIGDLAEAFAQKISLPFGMESAEELEKEGYNEALGAWYRDAGRRDRQDHETLEELDQALETTPEKRERGKSRISARHLHMLCEQPDAAGQSLLTARMRGTLMGVEAQRMDNPINQAWLQQIMRDQESVRVSNVPFRDGELARRIFPDFETGLGQD